MSLITDQQIPHHQAVSRATKALAIIVGLFGLAFIFNSFWERPADVAPSYLLAGVGLLIAASLIMSGRLLGMWVFLVTFLGSITWAASAVLHL